MGKGLQETPGAAGDRRGGSALFSVHLGLPWVGLPVPREPDDRCGLLASALSRLPALRHPCLRFGSHAGSRGTGIPSSMLALTKFSAGPEKVALPGVWLFDPDSTANFGTLFQKKCEAGETVLIGTWSVPVFVP